MTNKIIEHLQAQLNQLANTHPDLALAKNEQWTQINQDLEHLSHHVKRQDLWLQTAIAISNSVNSSINTAELLTISVDLIKNNLDFYYVGVFLVDSTNRWLELAADNSLVENGNLPQQYRLEINDTSPPGMAILNQQILTTPYPELDQLCFNHVDFPDAGAEAVIPLNAREQVMGLLLLQSAEPTAFSNADDQTLQTLASQLANAIQNTDIFDAADQRLEQLIDLHNIYLQIDSHLTTEPLLEDVAQLSAKLLGASACVVKLIKTDKDLFTVKGVYNPPQGIELNQTYTFATDLSSQIVQTRQAMLANNWLNFAAEAGYEHNLSEVQAILGVPIAVKNTIVGTIEVYSFTTSQAFDDNDRYTLSLLADQTAAALEKTHLFNQAEHNRRFLKTVIEHIPDPIFIKDKEHTWLEMNQANASVIGHPEADLIGKTDQDYFSTELATEFYRRDNIVFETNEIYEHEDKTTWGDGQEHIAYTRLIPIPDVDGQPEYLLGITNDITERKAHEIERERFLAETAALYNGSRAIVSALSERQIFDVLFELICLENPTEIVTLRFELVHDEPIWAKVRAVWTEQDNPINPMGTRLYLPDAPHGRLLTTTDPLFIEDFTTDARLSKAEREALAPTGTGSIAILPLTFISHEHGTVIVYFAQPKTFTEVIRRFWLGMTDQAGVALNNLQLMQDAAYRAIQMETAAEVTQAASSLIELDALLKSAVYLIQDRFELYYVGIFLVDEAHEWAELKAGTGEAGRLKLEKRHRLKISDDTTIGWSIHHRQPRIALDVGKNAIDFQYSHLPKTRSEMALPLIYRNQIIGAVTVQSQEQAAFSQTDIIFLQTMADQLANAIENSRLYVQVQLELVERKRAETSLQHRNEELATFNRVAAAITSTSDPHDRFQQVTREVVDIFNARRSDIALLTSDRTELTVMAGYATTGVSSAESDVISLANNPSAKQVIDTGKSLVVPNAQTNPLTEPIHDLLQEMEIACIIIIPILTHSGVVGTLGIDLDVPNRQFTPVEVKLAETIAGQISGAIENAQLLEQTQAALKERQHAEENLLKALERTESLYRIGDVVATATDRQVTFETILGEYLRLLNLKWGGVSIIDKAGDNRIRVMYIDGQPVQTNIRSPLSTNLLFQHLIQNPEPLIIGDVYTHPLTKDNQMRSRLQAKSMLFLPLVLRGQVKGIVSAGSAEKDYTFSQGNIETGQAVADQLSIWLENRQLLAEAQHRSDRLQTAAKVSQAASSILDVDELINTSVNYIRDQFRFYYVGIFLVDEVKKWAVLRAGTGKAGRIQLEKKHRLKIGGESMIGQSVVNREARIALDVGEEGVRFKNPILPDTHSEMALPLTGRDEVIGALTVQSVERGAFSDEDITLLQTMADQLANAIINARLFENAAQARQEAEARLQETMALQQLSQNLAGTLKANDILDVFFEACTKEIGFEYVQLALVDKYKNRIKAIAGVGITAKQLKQSNYSLDSQDILVDIVKSSQTEIIVGWDDRFNKEIFEAEGHADWVRVFTPISLRQETIGVVEAGFNKNVRSAIQEFQVRLLRAFINQTALALDNAQRYEASQRAARREALIKEITTKVRASTDLATILQTTVKEVGQAISNKRAYIHLISEQTPPPNQASQPNGGGNTKSDVVAKRSHNGGQNE